MIAELKIQTISPDVCGWQGYGVFTDNTTYIHRAHTYDAADMFLIKRTIDMFPPNSLTTEFGMHQNFAVYYVDTFSNSIKAKKMSWRPMYNLSRLLFTITDIASWWRLPKWRTAPPETRTRFTIERLNDDRFKETFELAMQSQEYETLEKLVLRRIN